MGRWQARCPERNDRESSSTTATPKEYGADLRLHCLPTLGDMPLGDITARDIRHLIRVLEGAGLKGTSIRRALAPLKALLATAAEEGDIPANPAAGVQIRSAQKPEPVRALNDAELGAAP